MCPITPHTGYGVTSFNILKALIKNNYNVDLFPMYSPQVQSQEDKDLIIKCINRAQTSYSHKNPCLKIWHQYDLAARVGSGKYGALVFFELDKMNPLEINSMNNTDCIFVASKWAKKILEDNNITTKIIVSPLAVDTDVFQALPKKENEVSTYKFINIGKWEIRKGHDILIEAFNAAFTENDDVELWMMNHNPFLNEEQNLAWQKLYSSSKLKNKIKFVPRVNTHKEVAQIIAQTDCGIFPARAEGWNNEILEVMAMNKPIITTNYSAHTEYCTRDNSYLVDIDNLTTAKDDHFFTHGFGQWAQLGNKQIEQMIEHMRYVYTNNIRDNQNGLNTVKQYTWDQTASIISQELFT
jgi:glycosyltransferase involved in cell wall biosynthesis